MSRKRIARRIARRIPRRRHLVVGVAPRHVLVHEEAPRLAGEHDELLLARAPRVVRRRHALHHRREHGVAVDGAPRLVRLDERPELQVGEDVAGHEDEVGLDPAARLDLAQRVARRVARRVRLEHAQHTREAHHADDAEPRAHADGGDVGWPHGRQMAVGRKNWLSDGRQMVL